MIYYDAKTGSFEHNDKRHKGHLNIGVLHRIIKDIITQTPLNDAEWQLIDDYVTKPALAAAVAAAAKQSKGSTKQVSGGTSLTGITKNTKSKKKGTMPRVSADAYDIAKAMQTDKFLSTYGCAVCHKIPYNGVQQTLRKMLNDNHPATHPSWGHLTLLLQGLHHGSGLAASDQQAIMSALGSPGSKQPAADVANAILADFDKSDDNLSVGFAQTNSSIGEHIDKHYPLLTTGNVPVQSTPRGAQLEKLLNALETSLGMGHTKPVQDQETDAVTKVKITWEKTSGISSIGFVVIT